MVRDIVRALAACVVIAVGAGVLIEVRHQLAVIDIAHRMAIAGQPQQPVVVGVPPERPLARLGKSVVEFADSALSIVR